mgnify:CR=1 FL=1
MKYFNCFNIVKLVTDEASNQFSPLFSEKFIKAISSKNLNVIILIKLQINIMVSPVK